MKRNIFFSAIAFIMVIMVFAGGFLIGFNYNEVRAYLAKIAGLTSADAAAATTPASGLSPAGTISSVEMIDAVINHIIANSINQKTRQELIQAAIEGILDSLEDRYADYFSREEYERILESYSGTMSGIGVVVSMDEDGRVVIVKVIEDAPAFGAGLADGDIITEVEGISLKDMSLEKIVAMIKGEEGTDVTITIFRPSENKSIEYTITRKSFYVPNFYIDVVDEDIVYIRYVDFQENGAKKLDEKLKNIIKDGSKGIILDFRNNLGGTLDDAVELCDLFLNEGVIVSVRGRSNNNERTEEFKAKKGAYSGVAMIVLVNGYSASAAELAAGALKDLGGAILMGENTFGKGTVQILNKLPDGSGIKYTTARYYLPSGKTIDGTGIEPDIYVAPDSNSEEDVQLKKAIEEMRLLIDR